MEKSRFAFEKFVEFENFMEWGHAPKCLLEELAEFARYFKNDDFLMFSDYSFTSFISYCRT